MNVSAIPVPATPGQQTSPADAKLRRAAQDFEAILIGTWLKEVQESFAARDESAGAESYRSLGVEAVAGALAKSGGLGVARLLLQQLAPGAKDVP